MATRKTKRATAATRPLFGLQDTLRNLQRDAEQMLKKARREVAHTVSRPPPSGLGRLTREAVRLRRDIESRARNAAGKVIEQGTEQLVATIVARQLPQLIKRRNLPTREEIDDLTRRLSAIEKKLAAPASARATKSGTVRGRPRARAKKVPLD